MLISKLWGHALTINKHKFKVMRLCFKCGMYKQGLLHDLSKYSLSEFVPGVRYYQGYRSPITAEKQECGYSKAWLHHKGRNKHHYEYWVDIDPSSHKMIVNHIPLNYILESAIDRISASKVYNGPNYNDSLPLAFLNRSSDASNLGEENYRRIVMLLSYLEENGEEKALKYYSELYRNWKIDNRFDI